METKPKEKRKMKAGFRIAVSAVFWIGIWALAAARIGKDLVLPGPVSVLRSLSGLAVTADFWLLTLLTLLRILAGYLIGLVSGILLAALTCVSELADALITPLMRVIRATPVASFIILALLWMGKSPVPLLMAALMTAPVFFGNIREAYGATDPALIEMGRHYKIGRGRMLSAIYIPSAMPAFRAAALTSVGLAWKAGIAAEVLSQPSRAIGTRLYYSKIYLETPDLFAWTAVVICLSFILEKVMQRLIRGKSGMSGMNSQAEKCSPAEKNHPAEQYGFTETPESETAAAHPVSIRIRDLSFAYGEKRVFDHFGAELDSGRTCIMGPSGCGKTTLLRLIAGLETPEGGSVVCGGSRAVMMFQEDRLLPHLSALENAALVLPPAEKAKAGGFLAALGIDGSLMPGGLSGGMARRVALARALCVPSDVLLLDEPFKGLDPEMAARAAEVICREGKTIVAATHSGKEAELLGAKILRIGDAGQVSSEE